MSCEELKCASARFVGQARAEQRLSVRTCDRYEAELNAGISYLAETGPDADAALAAETVSRIIRRPKKGGGGPSKGTLRHRLSAWRTFCRYLVSREGWEEDPARGVEWAKAERPRGGRQVVTGEGLDRLVRAAKKGPPRRARYAEAYSARDAAIIGVLGHCGLRLSELVALDVSNVAGTSAAGLVPDVAPAADPDGPLLCGILRKGGKVDDLPLNTEAAHLLGVWLLLRKALPLPPGERALFVSRRMRRLSRRAVQHLVARLGKRAGVEVRVTPHLLRHSFCTALLRNRVPFPLVQQLMAHTQVSTTMRYAHPNAAEARAAVETLTDPDAR